MARQPITFEDASKRLKALGNKIVESTWDGWQEPCTIIFADGNTSTEHSPHQIYYYNRKTKPGKCGRISYTFEDASEKLKQQGKIDKDSYEGWNEICTFTFKDGTISDKHKTFDIFRYKYKTKPVSGGQLPHTFEVASEKLKLHGTIDKDSYKGMSKPCNFTFIDGTTSTEHTPNEIYSSNYKTKPSGMISKYTFEVASEKLKLHGTIDKDSYEGWQKPCIFTFIDGTTSGKHTPRAIYSFDYKTKPTKTNFDVNKPGYIYFFAYKVYGKTISSKIGITNNNITNRLYEVNNNLKDKSKGSLKHCVALFYFADGHKCRDAETIIKQEFERVTIENVVKGKNEMFSEEGALHSYLFLKMLKCCKEINGKSKRPEVKQLVKHIAKKL